MLYWFFYVKSMFTAEINQLFPKRRGSFVYKPFLFQTWGKDYCSKILTNQIVEKDLLQY